MNWRRLLMGWKLSCSGADKTFTIFALPVNKFLVTSAERTMQCHIPVPTDSLHRFRRQHGSNVVRGMGDTRHQLFQLERMLVLREVSALFNRLHKRL